VFSGELNARVVGVADKTGVVAVPLRATDATGTPASEVVITREVLNGPTAVGAKRTSTLHLRPALSVAPHWLLRVKSAEFDPLSAILVMVSGVGPTLLMVTECDELDVPTVWLANATAVGLKLTAVPVPVKGTVRTGLIGSLDAIETVAVRAPLTAGVKLTVKEQTVRAGTGRAHVPGENANSDAFAPPIEMLLMASATSPLLDTTRVWGALVVAITWTPNGTVSGNTAATGAIPTPLSETL
jgi:hypothetical protein